MEALHKAAFLGPKGENAPEFERLLLEVLHDHVFWRRNFHATDRRLITESDRRSEEYGETVAHIRDELFQILSELKRGAPLFSPRQVAHMVSDPTMPALVGYFAGMLYNQNNVVSEASPETVRKERLYMAALAKMIGYPDMLPETRPASENNQAWSWGHLASGGTSANLELLWMARNVRFFGLTLRLMAHEDAVFGLFGEYAVTTAGGGHRAIRDCSTRELFNLPISEITRLRVDVETALSTWSADRVETFIDTVPSIRRLGPAALMEAYNDAFPADRIRMPRVFIARTGHYCWKKGMDLVGLGVDALVDVGVDEHVRLDIDDLSDKIDHWAERGHFPLMVVGICGTTEEGSVDPLHRIENLRTPKAEKDITFWHHADAAMGGYFASMIGRDGLPGQTDLFSDDVNRALHALAHTDSVTIDPHKFGYIPYPCGAVLYRDSFVRDFVRFAAPYLADSENAGFSGFLGRWTLEGSRPGAAAVSCYLSQAVVPLSPKGHGKLMARCVRAARMIVSRLEEEFEQGDVQLRAFAEPDTTGFCFVLVPRKGSLSLEGLNAFTRGILSWLSVDGREDINRYEFLLSRTEVSLKEYRPHIQRILEDTGVQLPETNANQGLTLHRLFLMNPFEEAWTEGEETHARAFCTYLSETAARVLSEMTG